MKKLLFILAMALTAVQFVSAQDVVTKDEMQLPLQARNFIKQHFSDPKISYIKIDSEFLESKKYEAVLINGAEIEFNSKGEWTDVDCKKEQVPATIIPDYVKKYMSTNFTSEFVTQIERNRNGIEVELNNDLSLMFDKNGKFRRIDD